MVDTSNSKPGDVVNGYVLLAEGNWVPLSQPNVRKASTAIVPTVAAEQSSSAPEFSVGVSVLLSVVTLGIWQVIWTYKAMHLYREHSGREDGQDLDTLYWIMIGTAVASPLLVATGLGFLTMIACIVVSAILMNEMVKDRNAAAEQAGFSALMQHSTSLVVLNVICNVLAFSVVGAIVGLPILLIALSMLFGDHKRFLTATATA